MKYLRILLAVTVAFTLCSAFSMKVVRLEVSGRPAHAKEKKVYAFGVAASFNDTVVYYTEIQMLDSVTLDKRGFLPRREHYSYQLKNYLESKLAKSDYTCMIYFSENKGRLQKEAGKVKGKYAKGNMKLQSIDPSDFSFEKAGE